MASAFVAGKMASEPEVAEEEAGRSLQDLHKRVHFSASLRFRLHQVAGLDMYGVVAERLEFAVFRSPFSGSAASGLKSATAMRMELAPVFVPVKTLSWASAGCGNIARAAAS